jgi:hypothetical protein
MIAVVLTALGLFLFTTLRSDLDRTIDDGLQARSADIAGLVRQSDGGLGQPGESPLTVRARGSRRS